MNIQTILYYNNIQTIETFGRDIYNGEINLKQDDNDQANLLVEVMDIPENKNKTRPQNSNKNTRKKMFLKTCMHFLRVERKSLMLLKVKYFQ